MVLSYTRGKKLLGLCDNERHELLISDQASTAQQIQTVCHEYLEAWIYHFGQKLNDQDKEIYCDLFGLAMTQFVLDFIQSFRSELEFSPTFSPASPQQPATERANSMRIKDPFEDNDFNRPADLNNLSIPLKSPPCTPSLADCSTMRQIYMEPQSNEAGGWVVQVFEPLSENRPVSAAF